MSKASEGFEPKINLVRVSKFSMTEFSYNTSQT